MAVISVFIIFPFYIRHFIGTFKACLLAQLIAEFNRIIPCYSFYRSHAATKFTRIISHDLAPFFLSYRVFTDIIGIQFCLVGFII